MKSTHSDRLERYLGKSKCEELSGLMKGWYGPPIALHGVPGKVYMTGDGDFIGECRAGFEMNLLDHATDLQRRVKRALRVCSERERHRLNAGFSSLSDLISEATSGGKKQDLYFRKTGLTSIAYATHTLWRLGDLPQAGGAGSAAPGGRAPDKSTTGAFNALNNAAGGDTLHIVSSFTTSATAGYSLLLYDRIFDVAKTMNSNATETVSGVPTRYQSTTPSNAAYAGGNFLFVEVGGTALANTAHNWTTCTYTDQGGNASTLPSLTGVAQAATDRLDHPNNQWFAPLEAGDVGIQTLTQMQCSTTVATGAINFVIGHPIAWIVHPLANQVMVMDYINTAFNLTRVFDDACLSFLVPQAPATSAMTFTGQITLVSG